MSTTQREVFAREFARQILVPRALRAELSGQVEAIHRPAELCRVASRIGVLPSTLLSLGQDGVPGLIRSRTWMFVEHVASPSGHEAKLRIVRAYYDRRTLFVPRFMSIERYAGAAEWLESALPGDERMVVVPVEMIWREGPGGPWRRSRRSATLTALRLRGSFGTGRDKILLSCVPGPHEGT